MIEKKRLIRKIRFHKQLCMSQQQRE